MQSLAPFDINPINKWIKEQWGSIYDGRPRFRVVWANNQTEKRLGVYNKFHGAILLAESQEVELKEVPKYPGPDYQDYWVLERLVLEENPEIPNSRNGSYEPIFVFKTNKGAYLVPNQKSITLFLYFAENGEKSTPWGERQRDDRIQDQEVKEFREILDEQGGSFLHKQMKEGEAVSMGGIVADFKENK